MGKSNSGSLSNSCSERRLITSTKTLGAPSEIDEDKMAKGEVMPNCEQHPHPSAKLFESPLVQVGHFRCPTSHPLFSDSGPTKIHCFVFPREACWIQHEGGDAFVADATTVPLYNPGHPYRRRPISEEGDRTDWFGVSEPLLREMLTDRQTRNCEHESRLFRSDYATASSESFFRQRRVFQHVSVGEDSDTLFVEESVIAVLDHVLATLYPNKDEPERRQHRDLAEATKALLAERYVEPTGISALATTVGASVYHLCRVFRRHSGRTIHRYRTELRLRRSLELLSDSGEDILSIAVALGYSGHSHYTSAFHRCFGMTPSEYRLLARQSASAARLIPAQIH
jgi:AraC-like DNA-binding protein